MILKVLKAMFTNNEAGLPGEWPIEANIAMEGEEITPPWIKMSLDEFNALRETLKASYQEWEDRQKVLEAERLAAAEAERKMPHEKLKKKLEKLGFEEDEIDRLIKK